MFPYLLADDPVMPVQWHNQRHDGHMEAGERRLFQALVFDALHQLARCRRVPGDREAQADAAAIVQWIRDLDGVLAHYTVTFRQAIERGFPRLDADILREELLSVRLVSQNYRRAFVTAGRHRVGAGI